MTPTSRLTNRERQILTLIARGHTNYEICHRLGIRYTTVKNHITNIFQKLHTDTRTAAVMVALHRREIQLPALRDIPRRY